MRLRHAAAWVIVAAVLLAGCAAPAPRVAPPATPQPSPSLATREKHAAILLDQGRLADALTQWRILRTIDPDNRGYAAREREVAEAIDARVEQHLRTGKAAADKDENLARREFLAALQLDPANATAIEQLRRLEFDRVWRVQAQKLEALKSQEDRKSATASEQERFYFELAAVMYRQGDYAGAAREMQKYLNSYPRDAQARKLIADSYTKLAATQREQGQLEAALHSLEQARRFSTEPGAPPNGKRNGTKPVEPKPSDTETQVRAALANEYYEKALRVQRTNLAQAIEWYQKALEYDPNHVKAQAKLAEAQRMQKNLQTIGK